MKTRIILSLIALSFSFVGCYTSFAAREYEEETYGQVEGNAPVDSMIVFEDENGKLDTVYLYAENYAEDNEEPVQDVTVINNYYDDDGNWVDRFYWSPSFYAPVAYYPYCDPFFYDPFYCNYYPPYPYPYYGGNVFVYGDLYVGHYNGYNYSPSPERYRTSQSHWTNLRNNDGGRSTSRKSRDSYRTLPVTSWGGRSSVLGKGINLDRDMEKGRVSKRRTELASLNNGGIRKANLEITDRVVRRDNDVKRVSAKPEKTTRTKKIVKREAVDQTKPKRTSSKSKYTRQNTNRKRAYTEIQKRSSYGKRKNKSYQSKRTKNPKEIKSSSNNSRSSYKPKSSSNSNRSSRSSYTGNKSSSSRSSYSGSSSKSSSSRSSYTGSSSRSSSSRSSYSRPSSSSSSRSSSARSSGSRSSGSSRSSGKRR